MEPLQANDTGAWVTVDVTGRVDPGVSGSSSPSAFMENFSMIAVSEVSDIVAHGADIARQRRAGQRLKPDVGIAGDRRGPAAARLHERVQLVEAFLPLIDLEIARRRGLVASNASLAWRFNLSPQPVPDSSAGPCGA
jgi:hypothetical protein